MYGSETLEDQGSEKSGGPMAEFNDAPNGNTHSELHDEEEFDDSADEMDYAEQHEDLKQQDDADCDKDALSETHTPTQVDRENEVPIKTEQINQQNQEQDQQDTWYLPANKDICTLEEIRRGQVINKTAGNECPVPGCGKKINESRIDPTPGTIASGLRTHVLFVHYGVCPNRKLAKKKKSLWGPSIRGLRTSPRKLATHTSSMLAATSKHQDSEVDFSALNSSDISNSLSSLIQKSSTPMNLSRTDIDKRSKKTANNDQQNIQFSSLQSLILASGGAQKTTTARPVRKQQPQQQHQQQQDTSAAQRNQMNPMASSLFSILAGLTQQQQQQPNTSQPPVSRANYRSAQSNNSLIAPQSRSNSNTNRQANSSLLSLLNEKISGNVATSLQNQLRKTIASEGRSKAPTARNQYNDTNSNYIQPMNNESNYNGGGGVGCGTSILNGLISNNGDNRISLDSSIPINSFVETMASKTGSNIGPLGIAQVKKMLEKFTASLLYSSQTIADHYIEPFGGEVAQQKPEISASDVILAYKMMLKTHGQP